mmetsp:Transcript_1173/g.875  ORF Transcript_1173/g.875 Transcript_1173/m.875 type:complete len:114 (-) Transcript_1173:276-617(-)
MFADKDKQRNAKKKLGATLMNNSLDKTRNKRLRAGYNALASGVALTKMQKRVALKMAGTYYDKLKRFFTQWRMNTFDNYRELIWAKKSRAIDRLVRSLCSEEHYYFLRWTGYV